MVSSSFVVLLPGGSGFLGAPPKALPQVFLQWDGFFEQSASSRLASVLIAVKRTQIWT